jgi:hypothetical protein
LSYDLLSSRLCSERAQPGRFISDRLCRFQALHPSAATAPIVATAMCGEMRTSSNQVSPHSRARQPGACRALEWWETRLGSPAASSPHGARCPQSFGRMAQRTELWSVVITITLDGLVRLLLGRSPRYAGDFNARSWSQLLHENPPRAPGFSARFPGVVAVAGTLLEQLGDSGRSPQEIELSLDRWAAVDHDSAPLAADIRELLIAYRGLRDRLGLSDRSDSLREALNAAHCWTRPLAFWLHILHHQRRLMVALAQLTKSCSFSTTSAHGPGDSPVRASSRGGKRSPPTPLSSRPRCLPTRLRRSPTSSDTSWTMGLGRNPLRHGPAVQGSASCCPLVIGTRPSWRPSRGRSHPPGLRPGDIAIVARHIKAWGLLGLFCFPAAYRVRWTSSSPDDGLGYAFITGYGV